MATFKITVPDKSDLGVHIADKSGRDRSMEVFLLASIGLKNTSLDSKSSVKVVNKSEVGPLEQLTSSGDISVIEQGSIVDFGDDLTKL